MSDSIEPPAAKPVRNLTVLTRRATVTPDEFRRHWLEVHAPLVRQLPHIRRYAQNHVVASGTRTGYPTSDYGIDGVVEFVFDSLEGAELAFESDLGRRVMDDARDFIEQMRVYTVEEHVIIDRTESS
jgi:uncharacterized protein (TIGR02118 family)